MARVLVALISCFAFWGFLHTVDDHASGKRRMLSHPDVVRISNQPTQVAFGVSPKCGDVDCWVLPDFDRSSWAQATLPKDPIAKIKGYADGLKTGSVYYAIPVAPTQAQQQIKESLAFTPMYVNHDHYEVYRDGALVAKGSDQHKETISFVSPIADHNMTNVFVIKATLSADDVGLNHYGEFLVGPQSVLNAAYTNQEKANITFFLLFLLAKGAVLAVFSLIYLHVRERGLGLFLLFGILVTTEYLLQGNFLQNNVSLSLRIVGFFLLKTAGVVALASYLLQHDSLLLRRGIAVIGSASLLAVGLIGYDAGYGSKTFSIPDLFHLTNALWVGFTAVALVRMGWRLYRTDAKSGEELALIAGLTFYLIAMIYEFYFKSYVGFDRRPVYDLAFFLLVAWNCARSFGANEQRVKEQAEEIANNRASLALSRAVQMVAHDIRRPQTEMHYFLERVEAMVKGKGTIDQEELMKMRQVLSGTSEMIDDALSFGSEIKVRRTPVDLKEVVEAITSAMPIADWQWTAGHIGLVRVDRQKMVRILQNLLGNAYDAGTAEDQIRIWTATQNQDDLVINIENPAYIDEDVRHKIFDAFFTSGKKNGTGLGLSVVKQLVEAHGGTIECYSTPETGTRFAITLPGVIMHAAPATNKTVVVLEDSIFLRQAWPLSTNFADIRTYASPQEFADALNSGEIRRDQIVAMVSDYHFAAGDLTGEDIAQDFHQDFPVYLWTNRNESASDVVRQVCEKSLWRPQQVLDLIADDLRRAAI